MKLKRTVNLNIYVYACRLTFCFFILSVLARVLVSGSVAVQGDELAALYEDKKVLSEELIVLEVEDTALSTLSYVEGQAKSRDFVGITDSLLVLKPTPVAALVPFNSNNQ